MNTLIINTALTGAVSDKSKNPAVPYTADEVLADTFACVAAGTAMGHFHVRTDEGRPTNDADRYARLFGRLRTASGLQNLVIVASTSGRHGQTIKERTAVLRLDPDVRPDMASLTLSSLNFPTGVSATSPDDIRRLAEAMGECGVKPELEVFDLGMAAFARKLVDEGLLKPPHYVNLILGNVAGAQADPLSVGALTAALPANSIISLGGIGRAQIPAQFLAIAATDGLRTGLEDNLRLPDGALATNAELVRRAAVMAALSGRVPETADGLRARLGLALR